MKECKINSVKAYLFADHLIVSLDKKWIEIFNEIPSFNIIIDKNNRLNLCSVKPIKNSKNKPIPQLQEIVV